MLPFKKLECVCLISSNMIHLKNKSRDDAVFSTSIILLSEITVEPHSHVFRRPEIHKCFILPWCQCCVVMLVPPQEEDKIKLNKTKKTGFISLSHFLKPFGGQDRRVCPAGFGCMFHTPD